MFQMKNGPVIVSVLFENSRHFMHQTYDSGRILGRISNPLILYKVLENIPYTFNSIQIINQNVVQSVPEIGQIRSHNWFGLR